MRIPIVLIITLLSAPAAAGLRVVTTTSDLAALASEVGGKSVTVQALAPANQDPHYVDPRPNFVVQLAKADLLIVNGLELEVGWLPPLLSNARNPSIQAGGAGYLDASRQVRRLEVGAQADRSRGDIHPGGNPHFLHDPRAGAAVALAIAERMASIAPKEAASFRSNAARVADELRRYARQERQRFAALPAAKRRVVSYHRSLVYLLDWLGLERVTTIEPKPGVAPSPAHVARVIALMRKEGIGTILQERYYPNRTSRTIARMAKARLVLLPGGADLKRRQRYVERLRDAARGIYEALAR